MRIRVEEREVTVALTSERRRPTHSGTGDGIGGGVAIRGLKMRETVFGKGNTIKKKVKSLDRGELWVFSCFFPNVLVTRRSSIPWEPTHDIAQETTTSERKRIYLHGVTIVCFNLSLLWQSLVLSMSNSLRKTTLFSPTPGSSSVSTAEAFTGTLLLKG